MGYKFLPNSNPFTPHTTQILEMTSSIVINWRSVLNTMPCSSQTCIYTISHCFIAIKTNDAKTITIPLLFLFAGVINIVSWFIVYQFVTKLSKENIQLFPTNCERVANQNHVQIRYNANGKMDIFQDLSRLSPGVYSIAPVHKKTTTSCSKFMSADEIRNDLMLYPSPESGIFCCYLKYTKNIAFPYLNILY